MSENHPSEKRRCIDYTNTHHPPLETHTFREVDQELLLDISRCAIYKLEQECIYSECQMGAKTVELVGSRPVTEQEFETVMYDLYEEFYHNPRIIGYRTLMELVPKEEPEQLLPLTDYLAAAVDLGCRDEENERRKRKKEDVLAQILPEDGKIG